MPILPNLIPFWDWNTETKIVVVNPCGESNWATRTESSCVDRSGALAYASENPNPRSMGCGPPCKITKIINHKAMVMHLIEFDWFWGPTLYLSLLFFLHIVPKEKKKLDPQDLGVPNIVIMLGGFNQNLKNLSQNGFIFQKTLNIKYLQAPWPAWPAWLREAWIRHIHRPFISGKRVLGKNKLFMTLYIPNPPVIPCEVFGTPKRRASGDV